MNARRAAVDPANGFLSKVKAQAAKRRADRTRVPGKYPQCAVLGLLLLTNLCKSAPTDWEDTPMSKLSGSDGEGLNGRAYSPPPRHGHGLDDDNNDDTAAYSPPPRHDHRLDDGNNDDTAYSPPPRHGYGLDDGNNVDTEAISQQSQKRGFDHAKDDDEPSVSPVRQSRRRGNKDDQNDEDQEPGIRNTSARKKSTRQRKGAPRYR